MDKIAEIILERTYKFETKIPLYEGETYKNMLVFALKKRLKYPKIHIKIALKEGKML